MRKGYKKLFPKKRKVQTPVRKETPAEKEEDVNVDEISSLGSNSSPDFSESHGGIVDLPNVCHSCGDPVAEGQTEVCLLHQRRN